MFFKKHREKQAQERNEQRINAEKRFSASIELARAKADPAEQLVALRTVRNNIDAYLAGEARSADKRAGKATKWADTISELAFWGGATALSGPFGWVTVGIIGGSILAGVVIKAAGNMSSKAIKKRHEAEIGGHVETLKGLQGLIDKAVTETIDRGVEEIPKSAHYDALKKIPDLYMQFSAAALKKAEEKITALENNQKPVVKKNEPRP